MILSSTIILIAIIGVGVGMARDAATLMVGQYFKRRRELVRGKYWNTEKSGKSGIVK